MLVDFALKQYARLLLSPAERVFTQTSSKHDWENAVQRFDGCGCRKFEEEREDLLRDVLGFEFSKPSAHFAIGSMDRWSERENENGLY